MNHTRAWKTFSLLPCLQMHDVVLSKMDINQSVLKKVQRARNVPRSLPSIRAPGLHFLHSTWTSSPLILLLLSWPFQAATHWVLPSPPSWTAALWRVDRTWQMESSEWTRMRKSPFMSHAEVTKSGFLD